MKTKRCFYRSLLFSLTVIIGTSTALYLPSLSGEFVWDDHLFITQSDWIKNPEDAGSFFTTLYWKDYHPGTKGRYRPLRTISFAANYALGKLNPYGYHILNLTFHVFNGILVFFVAHLLLRNCWGAGVAALLFACHPLHTEAVAWVKNRAELFALFFFLLSFLLVIKSERSRGKFACGMFLSLGLVSYLFALMSKETAVTFPLVLVLYGALISPPPERKEILLRSLPFWILTLLYGLFLFWGIRGNLPVGNPGDGPHVLVRLYLVGKTIFLYGASLLFPINLNADLPLPVPGEVSMLDILPVIAVAGMMLLVFLRLRRSSPVAAFSLLYILSTLLPSSNLIPLEGRAFAEQRLYLPSLGFVLLTAYLLRLNSTGEPSRNLALSKVTLVALIIVSYAFLTHLRIPVWHDEQRLWEDVIRKNSAHERGYYNLGLIYEEKGEFTAAVQVLTRVVESNPASFEAQNALGTAYAHLGQLEKALLQYRLALKLNPSYSTAHYNLGNTLFKLGRYDEAIKAYEEAISLKPDYADAYANMGWAYQKEGMLDRATKALQTALRLDPRHALAFLNLGRVYYERGNLELAEEFATRALRLSPDNAEAPYVLGNILAHQGKYPEAREAFQKAVRLNPQFAEAHNNLGNLLQREGKPEEALREYEEAIRADPNFAEAHNNAANLHCLRKNFPEALQEYRKALSLRPDYFEAQFGLAGLFLMKGDFAQAGEEYRKAHVINPEKVESSLRRALDLNLAPVLKSEIKKILSSLVKS